MRTMIAAAVMLVAATAFAVPPCKAPLPKPSLQYLGATAGAPGFFNEWFSIPNFSNYDNGLFVASPSLPACGLNTNASRTWLEIYTGAGTRIYGYCALSNNTQLQKLSFPWKTTAAKPHGFFVRLVDRRCNRVAQSNINPSF